MNEDNKTQAAQVLWLFERIVNQEVPLLRGIADRIDPNLEDVVHGGIGKFLREVAINLETNLDKARTVVEGCSNKGQPDDKNLSSPFPYLGGKRPMEEQVWSRLGKVLDNPDPSMDVGQLAYQGSLVDPVTFDAKGKDLNKLVGCCLHCGKILRMEEAVPEPDPYSIEIMHDDTPLVQCPNCIAESARNI